MNVATRTLTAPRQRGVTRVEKSSDTRGPVVSLGFRSPQGGYFERGRDV